MRAGVVCGVMCAVTGTAAANARQDLATVIDQQLDAAADQGGQAAYAPGGTIVITDKEHYEKAVLEPSELRIAHVKGHADKHVEIQLSLDGNSAWASFDCAFEIAEDGHDPDTNAAIPMTWTVDYRISDVFAKVGGSWRIVASVWSEGVDNAKVNKAAKAHPPKLAPLPAGEDVAPIDDRGLRPGGSAAEWRHGSIDAAWTAWLTGSKDAVIAKRAVVYGSAPGERTTDGPGFRAAWLRSWANHVTVDAKAEGLTRSGATGWVIANVRLDKATHQVPFRVLAVFDKTPTGWQLVHAHLASMD